MFYLGFMVNRNGGPLNLPDVAGKNSSKQIKNENLDLAEATSKSFQRLNKNENLDLAEEHIKIAEDLVSEEGKKSGNERVVDKLTKTQFDLEHAEADLDELSADDFDDEIADD